MFEQFRNYSERISGIVSRGVRGLVDRLTLFWGTFGPVMLSRTIHYKDRVLLYGNKWIPKSVHLLSRFVRHFCQPAWIEALCAVALVVITFFYTHYAAQQVSEMTAAVQVSRANADAAMKAAETAQDQLRAFQNTEGAHIRPSRFEGNIAKGRIRIPIENYGHMPSPSMSVFVHVYKELAGEQMPFYAKHYNFGGDRTEIPPGTGRYGVTVPIELAPGEIEKIKTGQEQLYIGITIKYDNGFGKESQPGFCYVYVPGHPENWDACGVVSFEDLQKMPLQK